MKVLHDREGALRVLVVVAMSIAPSCRAGDAFDAVKCDGDVAKTLVGKKIGNEPVEQIEKHHAAIGLKDEGAEEISDALSYQSWTLCGASYHMIEKGGAIRDVVRADHSRKNPSFLGTCQVDGAATPYRVFAILDASAAKDASSLPASTAWRIEESGARFVHMDTKGMACPRDGIASADGGP